MGHVKPKKNTPNSNTDILNQEVLNHQSNEHDGHHDDHEIEVEFQQIVKEQSKLNLANGEENGNSKTQQEKDRASDTEE